MEFVKGHSGDKYNERVDLIATNYSKGIPLNSKLKKSQKEIDVLEELAPHKIQTLFTRNELMNKFSEKKYLLSSNELKELIGEENFFLIEKYSFFEWRNWKLIPRNQKYWIIENKNT